MPEIQMNSLKSLAMNPLSSPSRRSRRIGLNDRLSESASSTRWHSRAAKKHNPDPVFDRREWNLDGNEPIASY